MLDNNERMTLLDNMHLNNNVSRIINTAINAYKDLKSTNILQDAKKNALQNALFIKYVGIDYELIFQSQMVDNKFNVIL